MGRLENITFNELQEQLAETNGKKPAQRILTAIAYKQGDSKETLADHDNRAGASRTVAEADLKHPSPRSNPRR